MAARALVACCLLAAIPLGAGAQVIRGRVTETTSRAGVSGVLVEMYAVVGDSLGPRVGATLSDASGAYAVLGPSAGTYRVSAKRIGVRRVLSSPIVLAAGETAALDLSVDALLYTLPEVAVVAITSCDKNPKSGARVAALWEEARTALYATQLSLRDRLFHANVVRYLRELDAKTQRVISEVRSETNGTMERPFAARSADSLSEFGYWSREPDGMTTYYGPDAEVLTSDAFVRDHCFREVRGGRSRRGLVGLGFRPVASRDVPDVLGTLWLDGRSFELRYVEFSYADRGAEVDVAQLGGEVHFARLASGAWFVRRWFIRLPILGRPAPPVGTATDRAPWILVRPTALSLREEGGEVATTELAERATLGTVRGELRDSANTPLAGVEVRVAGTGRVARSNADGSFLIDSVPTGRQSVIVHHPSYDSLGVIAGDAPVTVNAARASRANVRLLDGRALYQRFCLGALPARGVGALRVSVRTAGGDSLISHLPVQVSWRQLAWWAGERDSSDVWRERPTTDRGSVTVCEVPAERDVRILVARPQGGTEPIRVVRVPNRSVTVVVVTLTPP